ncbi:MAG: peptidoglycan DD-metalloendopeptidase family protein, partial [Eubacterium sp.]
ALEKTRNEVALKQAAIEEDKAKVETAKSEKQNSLDNQKSIKAQKDELLAKNQQVIKTYQAEIDKQEAVYQQANRELAQIAAAKEAEAARIRAEEEARLKAEAEANKNTGQNNGSGNTANNDSGTSWTPSSGLIWPVPGYGYSSITSWFGYRPAEDTNGVGTTNHGGVDVGIPTGTNVLAAGDGVVTYAGWNGGYGYCVMIAVDGGTVLYGHLSEVIVSDGQYVRQGQTVAYSGNSGNSTGPHLHLSFFDPDPTDPLNYMHW